jgi:nicotinate-nucleotide adenylyltransferase
MIGLDPRAREAQRLGVFGGTFDPIHNGHLHVARAALAALELDHIVCIPAGQSPHKASATTASGEQRVAMLKLALQSCESLAPVTSIWDFELQASGPSYTLRTLEQLAQLRGQVTAGQEGSGLYFLMGSDQFAGLPKWTEVERVFQLAKPCTVLRPGSGERELAALEGKLSPKLLGALWEGFLSPTPVDIAATDLRTMKGQSKRRDGNDEQPLSVAKYISQNGLYHGRAFRGQGTDPGE